MATTTQLNGALAGLKGGRRRWETDPTGALDMARAGSRKFMERFKTAEERSAYFTDLIRKRWQKSKTTTNGGEGARGLPLPETPSAAADGGGR